MAGDTNAQVPGEALPERILRILALLRYHTRLTSSPATIAVVAVKRCAEYLGTRLPDREDVGVFFGSIFLRPTLWQLRLRGRVLPLRSSITLKPCSMSSTSKTQFLQRHIRVVEWFLLTSSFSRNSD